MNRAYAGINPIMTHERPRTGHDQTPQETEASDAVGSADLDQQAVLSQADVSDSYPLERFMALLDGTITAEEYARGAFDHARRHIQHRTAA